jgi:molybdate transport system permease protein
VIAWIAISVICIPVIGLFVRVPWTRLDDLFANNAVGDALWISLQTSIIATALCLLLGVPLAWVMANTSARTHSLLRAVVTIPVVLPPVVGGIALLAAVGRRGVFGDLLSFIGVSLPYTRTAVVLSQVFVAMPFLVLAVENHFRSLDSGVIAASRVMGMSPLRSFFHVVLPMSWPAVVAGAVLAWARSVGEFGASITFAGSLRGRTQTLPMAVYELLENDWELAMGLSALMVVFAAVVILSLRSRLLNASAS